LNNRLSGDSRVALSRGPIPEIYISLTRPNETELPRHREWLVIPLDRIDPPLATSLIIWWLSGLAVLLLLAAWFSWHITRPITRLVDATDRLAAGKPARVEPAGPAEIKRLGERFNAMLEALSQSEATRRTLLAGLPHDLKAPLSRMWLRIEMSEDAPLKDGMRKDLQDMQQMVDQFIQYLRGSDPATYHFATFALNDWVSERVANWSGTRNEVMLVGVPTPLMVSADGAALSRLLDNLISNALHHGAPPVEVSLSCVETWAVLTVTDHGPGIPPERRAEAIKPFVRLDEARTRTGNVGLGLALAEAIAVAHGGSLTLDRATDHIGLKVELRLPLAA
jgi:two-component system osmolarity sensor histidine kinase EnvZ